MELRSRSRSKTPGLVEKNVVQVGNHVEVVTRTTRSSARVVQKFSEQKTQQSKMNMKSNHKNERGKYITSDYSSDDEVTSTKHITQNARNQFKEEYYNSNGNGDFSALKVYKEAGDYWNKFPKTDYTYSEHSKDRIEIAPGVIAMPNMSRKSLLHMYPTSEHVSMNKESNTDSFLARDVNEVVDYSNVSSLKPRVLFHNNNHEESVFISRRETSIVRRVYLLFISVFTTMFSWVYTIYDKQNSWVLWMFHKVYKFVSKVMLFDTWTMQGRHKKTSNLVKLCLLPLLFFAGWCLVTSLGGALLATMDNNASAVPTVAEKLGENVKITKYEHEIQRREDENARIFQETNAKLLLAQQKLKEENELLKEQLKRENLEPIIQEKIVKITEKIQIEPPSAEEIIRLLSKEQLEIIANNIKINPEIIVKNLIENEHFKTTINEYNTILIQNQIKNENLKGNGEYDLKLKEHESLLNNLRIEIEKIRFELAQINNQNNVNENIENFDVKLLKLKEYFAELIKNNNELLKDEITNKLHVQFNKELKIVQEKNNLVNLGVNEISDLQIKKIVDEALVKYDADKTGLVDYALEPSGGQILSTRCTENYIGGSAVVSIFGIPLWNTYLNTPRAVITPGIVPGECWAFQNFPGFLVIKLSAPIKISAFSYEHVSKLLVPNGKIDSAPKEFHVYGLQNEEDKNPILIGKYFYDFNGSSLQYFNAQNEGVFNVVELHVVSNHGNPNYTCLYRFRVHGSLHIESR